MTPFYCRLVYTVFFVVFCAVVNSIGAQSNSKIVSPQKSTAKKESATDSVLRYKIDSQLMQALAPHKRGANSNIEALEPVDVGVDTAGNLSVDISATITDSLLNAIRFFGGKILYPSKQYHTVRAIVNLSIVRKIAARQDVAFIQPAVQAQNNTMPKPRL